MASTDILPPGTPTLLGPSHETIAGLAEQIKKLSLENLVSNDPPSEDVAAQRRSRPPLVYTRSQALQLYKSPLVQAPDGMPQLKDWFGDWTEQTSAGKKETESSTTTNGTRERRFRRDAEEGADSSSRPNFRSALSQPSQMGNFKHQPLRGSERDKDRERDLREKDNDRLRSLSDKFDRERLSLSSASGLRGKERELAPHLASTSPTATRLTGQSQPSSTSRRADGRETSTRKRAGDNAEDWRKGGDGRGRDDKSDNTRNDRDEEPRARVRNGSKSRREASTTRRDRERDKEERDKDRDRDGDRNRDRRRTDRDQERDREERPARRARDRDGEAEDDSRHWRDDGKRDERVAGRRDRDKDRDRNWERDWERYDKAREESERTRDPRDRWDKEDARARRGGGRDRKGAAGDEPRDREDRDKDKDPAWMADYAPESSGGILGGKGLEGELDELQAWKKSMKERDQRTTTGSSSGRKAEPVSESSVPDAAPTNGGGGLDEIQQFKLIMKQAQDDKQPSDGLEFGPTINSTDLPPIGKDVKPPQPVPISSTSSSNAPAVPTGLTSTTGPATSSETSYTVLDLLNAGANSASRLGNGLSQPSDRSPVSLNSGPPQTGPSSESTRPAQSQGNPISGSRFFGNRSAAVPTAAPRQPEFSALSPTTNDPAAFPPNNTFGQFGGDGQAFQEPPRRSIADAILMRERQATLDAMRIQQSGGYSPSNQGFAERAIDLSHMSDYRRSMTGSPVSPYTDVGPGGMGQGGLEQQGSLGGRGGSRFAKLWDGDSRGGRPGHAPQPRSQNSVDLGGYPSPIVGRQDSGGFNNMSNADQLFALLNGQPQRRSTPVSQLAHTPSPNPASFSVNYPNQLGQQQLPIHQQPFANGSRQEILQESRMDDRFMPDNMVPGLRTAPLNRSRDTGGSYYGGDPLDDGLGYGGQRLPPPQARGLDPMLAGHPGAAAHLRNAGLPLQQGQFRGGPSPIQLQGQQRGVPVGLANLGSRPPHDPGQFIGAPMGMGGSLSGQSQGGFRDLNGGGMGAYGGGPQMRGPAGPPVTLGQGGLGGMGVQGIDPRSNQAQLLGLGGPGPMRSAGGGGYSGVPQGLGGPIPGVHMNSRQVPQQQQQQQQHFMQGQNAQAMMGHMQGGPGPSSQDLMALLMGGRRE